MTSASRSTRCAAVALSILFSASALGAQGWVQFPTGKLGYVTDYTTTGFVNCGDAVDSFGTCNGRSAYADRDMQAVSLVDRSLRWLMAAFSASPEVATRVSSARRSEIAMERPATRVQYAAVESRASETPRYFSMLIDASVPLVAAGVSQGHELPPWLARERDARISDDNLGARQDFADKLSRESAGETGPSRSESDDVSGPVVPATPRFEDDDMPRTEAPPVGSELPKNDDVVTQPTVTPEPATVLLMATGMGLMAFMWWRRRLA
jgi:hypothetical protein